MILALAEKELLNRLTTKTLIFFKKVLLYIIVLSRFTKINNLIHEEEKQEVAKSGGHTR